jgi:hypothetical protein
MEVYHHEDFSFHHRIPPGGAGGDAEGELLRRPLQNHILEKLNADLQRMVVQHLLSPPLALLLILGDPPIELHRIQRRQVGDQLLVIRVDPLNILVQPGDRLLFKVPMACPGLFTHCPGRPVIEFEENRFGQHLP